MNAMSRIVQGNASTVARTSKGERSLGSEQQAGAKTQQQQQQSNAAGRSSTRRADEESVTTLDSVGRPKQAMANKGLVLDDNDDHDLVSGDDDDHEDSISARYKCASALQVSEYDVN
jgi:hypothetical protein